MCMLPSHLTPTSRSWLQFDLSEIAVWGQWRSVASDPVQWTSAINTGPLPGPNTETVVVVVTVVPRVVAIEILSVGPLISYCSPSSWCPSWRHTTLASLSSQLEKVEKHTVPHTPLMHTSTRPSNSTVGPTNLTSPSEQLLKITEPLSGHEHVRT